MRGDDEQLASLLLADLEPSFYELPRELKVGVKARLVYYAFDILYLVGFDLRRAPLLGRKRVLSPGHARAGRQGLHPHAPRHGHPKSVRHRQALSRQLPRLDATIDRQRQRQGAVL